MNLSPLFTWRGCIASDTGPAEYNLTEGDRTISVSATSQRLAALVLSLHMNERGASAFPSITLLTVETGMSERQVRRALQALEAAGWLTVERSKGRRSNTYTATIPATVAGLNAATTLPPEQVTRPLVAYEDVKRTVNRRAATVAGFSSADNLHAIGPAYEPFDPVEHDRKSRESVVPG